MISVNEENGGIHEGQNQDTNSKRHFVVTKTVEHQSSGHSINHAPTEAGQHIKERDEGSRNETKCVSGDGHHSQSCFGAQQDQECRPKCTERNKEKDGKERIPPSESESAGTESPNTESGKAAVPAGEKTEEI